MDKMKFKEILKTCKFDPNPAQERAIRATEGPLLIIAGPGSGKTQVLILRTLYLLLIKRVPPENILLCTFTEKAARQLKERVKFNLIKTKKKEIDSAKMTIGTINSICNSIVIDNINYTNFGKNYDVLEELTQPLFLYENFNAIFGEEVNGKYAGHWSTKWTAIKGIIPYLNKITEERIKVDKLKRSNDLFVKQLARCYENYCQELRKENRIDFSHQQSEVLDLLLKKEAKEIGKKLRQKYKYIMVDEYQDTNYVQEQIMIELAKPQNNICVVGDDDQSLYRFRGATVRNIIEFEKHFNRCSKVKLEINYRSHPQIIDAYNDFMSQGDWKGKDGEQFRHDKAIKPDPKEKFKKYTSIFTVGGGNFEKEGQRIAEFIEYLNKNKIVKDLNQIAILLHSVRPVHSHHYIDALRKKGIKCYAPRARGYFTNHEVKELIGAMVHILNYRKENRSEVTGYALENMVKYCDECLEILEEECLKKYHSLANFLNEKAQEIEDIPSGGSLEIGLLDIFYEMLAYKPFSDYLEYEPKARNMAIFSDLVRVFQQYYHQEIITRKRREWLKLQFFNSFLRFLFNGGINEYEDEFVMFPSGYVQLMTIHQAKGLEFPVIIVGSQHVNIRIGTKVDKDLYTFYHREDFEPFERIPQFDRLRLMYVAFSRAKYFLALTCPEAPKPMFSALWDSVPNFDKVNRNPWKNLKIEPPEPSEQKLEFSLTSHINVYDTCPKQYQMYKEYEFSPARTGQVLFGTVVHQTIEDIHRHILDGRPEKLNKERIENYFNINFETLRRHGIHPLGQKQKEIALSHVLNYFKNNQDSLKRIVETEVDITVEKDTYYLTGRVDLIRGKDGKLELVDFKSQERPKSNDRIVSSCHKQLATYTHGLKEMGKNPERAIAYWTGEADKKNAVMEMPISEKDVDAAAKHFEEVVKRIRKKDFRIPPNIDKKICRDCDFRHNCGTKTK